MTTRKLTSAESIDIALRLAMLMKDAGECIGLSTVAMMRMGLASVQDKLRELQKRVEEMDKP